ncbi:CoA transferase subunit A [Microbacterium sp. ASV81]|uniref:CoA-transferase n=1 Tax=Microbacterium capsulatum TaxID=3041921 RepID=A0ABU0XEU9_9MICO|nr:CoA-transferase [Microbacterium sp. ASV81]MDQ4213644.1 CoA-transferase [Microbacterium sp. ASV81]
MNDKLTSTADVETLIRDGMTIGIGGWGSRRKPMSLIRAVVRSGARDLTVVGFGGPDVGILCATGQAARVVHGFVSLDTIAIDPHFAARRQAGTVENVEYDEAMLVAGLRAAGRRLPFEAIRSGIGSDAVTRNPALRTVRSPYDDGEELLAMPAIPLDLALLHLDRADPTGNAQCLGADPYFDDLFALAATTTVVSADEIVPAGSFADAIPATLLLNRTMVDHVVHSPDGAHFTAAEPSAARDEAFQRHYAASVSPETWTEFHARFVDVSDEEYLQAVRELHEGGER